MKQQQTWLFCNGEPRFCLDELSIYDTCGRRVFYIDGDAVFSNEGQFVYWVNDSNFFDGAGPAFYAGVD